MTRAGALQGGVRHGAPGIAATPSSQAPARQPDNAGAMAGNRDKAGAGVLADPPAPVSFTLPTPPSVNRMFRNVPGRGRVKTAHYDDFVHMGVTAIRNQKVQPVAGRVVVIIGVERMSDRADIDNRLKAMLDTIVKARVIEDDSLITAIAVTWLPNANGLSWVHLLPVSRLDLSFHPAQNGASGTWQLAPPTQGAQDGLEPQ